VLKVIGRRLLLAVPTVFVVSTFTFFLIHLVPGSPADFILGTSANPLAVQKIDAELGLDKPLLSQYLTWLGHAIHGNFGTSYADGEPVARALAQALPVTLSLAILSIIVALAAGLALGTAAAVRGGRIDSLIQGLSSIGLAIPSFWLAALLVVAFALKIKLFPATGYTPLTASPGQWLRSFVLPVAAVAAGALAQFVLQTRTSVLDVLSRDFVRTLQSTGVPRRRILMKHVLRNAAIPVTTVAGLAFVFALSGVVVVEIVFNLPGMGDLIVNAASEHDIPVLQGAVIYFSLIVVVVNLCVDLLTAWLDPRVHVS
jgi:peptide/nickel transport system permease protein